MRRFLPILLSFTLALSLLLLLTHPAHARQLAQSFYNITGITTRVLPNGVQITVETDGAVNFGVDRNEFLHTSTTGEFNRTALPLTSFRLRFVGARSRIPAYNDIGSYPVDFAETTLGDDELNGSPLFYGGRQDPSKKDRTLPRVDLRFHFYVPITVQNLTVVYGEYYGWTLAYFGLQPREASVTASQDRRSVIITVISDRVETVRSQNRPPRLGSEGLTHRLDIRANATGDTLRLDALHAPLSEIATKLAAATGVPLTIPQADSAKAVTLYLPSVPREGAIAALARASGLNLVAAPDVGGGYALTRGGGPATVTERIPLRYLKPESARLLLPDFLLRSLRADAEHNALVASGPPELLARIRADLAKLDLPPPQVQVEAAVYELSHSDADTLALTATLASGRPTFDTSAESLSVTLQSGQQHNYAAALTALLASGHARLASRPSLTLVSGDSGTLFAGQTRYITILQSDYGFSGGGQNVEALQLPVGTSLTVTATTSSGKDAPILLDLDSTIATVDSIEIGTGLPTVGTRTVSATVRVENGDTVILGGLTLADTAKQKSRLPLPLFGHLFGSHTNSSDATELIVLVTAHRVPEREVKS